MKNPWGNASAILKHASLTRFLHINTSLVFFFLYVPFSGRIFSSSGESLKFSFGFLTSLIFWLAAEKTAETKFAVLVFDSLDLLVDLTIFA